MVRETQDIPKSVGKALKENLSYCPDTGDFKWIKPGRGRRVNSKAGSRHSGGYYSIFITVDGVKYNILAHRAAWFMYYGKWPDKFIDHIDKNKRNNAITNLREATGAENLLARGKYLTTKKLFSDTITHNTYVGVDRMINGKWRAICARHYLGVFDTAEEAADMYNKFAKAKFGEFAHQNIIDKGDES